MPFIVYAAILIATVFGVALEWDSLVEPSAASRSAMHALSEARTPAPAVVQAPVMTPSARPSECARAGGCGAARAAARRGNAGATMRHRRLRRCLPDVSRLGLHL